MIPPIPAQPEVNAVCTDLMMMSGLGIEGREVENEAHQYVPFTLRYDIIGTIR